MSQGIVEKSQVVGVLMNRGEMEVVVDPDHVKDKEVVKVKRSPRLQSLRKKLLERSVLGPRTQHGEDHWDRVDMNAVKLCSMVPGADILVARLFAIFHDSCRHSEHSDPKHGHRAAQLLTEMYQGGKIEEISIEQFEKLEFACREHNGHGPVEDPTIGVCFDADRLDLIRVGIVPDPKLLSTQAAKGLICTL